MAEKKKQEEELKEEDREALNEDALSEEEQKEAPETEAHATAEESAGADEESGSDEVSDDEAGKAEASDESETENEAGDGEEDISKGLFKKKNKSDKKQDAMKEKVAELEDKVKRQLAEFENFRNRTEKEKTQMFETGAKSVIEKILPVVDNFERGLATVPEEEKGKPFAEGMEMIYKQLMTELEKMEVIPIPAVGEEFDPNLHNAVMQVDSEELESGKIAEELQKGYTYRGQVVRHSMVSVVN